MNRALEQGQFLNKQDFFKEKSRNKQDFFKEKQGINRTKKKGLFNINLRLIYFKA